MDRQVFSKCVCWWNLVYVSIRRLDELQLDFGGSDSFCGAFPYELFLKESKSGKKYFRGSFACYQFRRVATTSCGAFLSFFAHSVHPTGFNQFNHSFRRVYWFDIVSICVRVIFMFTNIVGTIYKPVFFCVSVIRMFTDIIHYWFYLQTCVRLCSSAPFICSRFARYDLFWFPFGAHFKLFFFVDESRTFTAAPIWLEYKFGYRKAHSRIVFVSR